jgi:hypothetical protein
MQEKEQKEIRQQMEIDIMLQQEHSSAVQQPSEEILHLKAKLEELAAENNAMVGIQLKIACSKVCTTNIYFADG